MTWRKEAFRQPQWRLLEDEIREQRTAIQGTALLCSGCTRGLRCRRPRSLQASEVPGHLGCPGLNSWTCGLYSISPDKIPPRPSVLLARTPGLIRVFLPRFQARCWGRRKVWLQPDLSGGSGRLGEEWEEASCWPRLPPHQRTARLRM